MTNYRSTLLLAFDLLHLPDGRRGIDSAFDGKPEWKATWLTEISSKGALSAARRMHERVLDLPALVDKPLKSAYIWLNVIGQRYLSRIAILGLADGDVHHLTHERLQTREAFLRLVDFFLPLDPEHRVWPQPWQRAYVLFLVPDPCPCDPVELSSSVTRLWDELNLRQMAPLPEVFLDLLVLPGQVLTGGEDLFAVSLNPNLAVGEDSGLVLPKTLLDLVLYILAPQAIRDLTRRLKRLPVGPEEAKRWRELDSSELLDQYLREHFVDRSLTLSEVLACAQDLRALEAQLLSNAIAQTENHPREPSWPDLVASPHRFRLSTKFLHERSASAEEYEYVRNYVEKWGAIATEYVRDLMNGQVAASNLSLQRTIKRLTLLAVIAAVLAIFVSLISI